MRMLLMAAAALSVSGCATMDSNPIAMLSTVHDKDAMHERAANVIGVPPEHLTFSDEVRHGDQTSFTVRLPNGSLRRCTVSAAFGMMNGDMTCPSIG